MNQVVLGVDIGGTNTVFGLIDNQGTISHLQTIPTQGELPFSGFISRLISIVDQLLQSNPETQLMGIGIGAPNGNHFSGLIQNPPNLSWGNVNIVQQLESHYNCPVQLSNDANCAAQGEKFFGHASEFSDFIMITLGTGLGSGIYSGGNLIYGNDGMAGELGHLSIDANGRQCNCGLKGCLEMYVSAKGFVTTIKHFLKQYPEDEFLLSLELESMNGKELDKAYDAGVKSAVDIYTYSGEKLGFGLAQAATLFSPSAFIFYGGYSNAGSRLLSHAKKAMDSFLMNNLKQKIQLLPSGLPDGKAGILGAASMIWATQ